MDIAKTLAQTGIVPVLEIGDATKALPLGRVLLESGIPAIEVTLRTAAGLRAISEFAKLAPELLVGAGTVLTVGQAEAAVEAGAAFIVSPGTNLDVVDWCAGHDVFCVPGVATPSEIQTVLGRGLTFMKLFPSEVVGGVKMLKALSGPFGDVTFMCTGGITPALVKPYLELPNVACLGGSWLTPKDALAAGDFETVGALCREAAALVREV